MTTLDLIELINNDATIEEIQSLIDIGVDLDEHVGKVGLCALHHSVYKNRADCARYLVEHGCNIDIQDHCGFTALHLSAKYMRIDIMKQLLKLGANVHVEDAVGCPALNLALQNGYEDCVEVLLKSGANPNKHYKYVGYEIHQLPDDAPKCLELLLKYGADPELRNPRGLTALHLAIKSGNIIYVHILLMHGANPNAVGFTMTQSQKKWSALHLAAIGAEKGIAELLLLYGAEINVRDGYGNTPLHHVAAYGDVDLVQLLINNGASVNVVNERNYQPLHRACSTTSDPRVIALLLDNEADANATTVMMETPMKLLLRHIANMSETSTLDYRECVLLLVNHGARVTLTADRSDNANILPDLQPLSSHHVSIVHLLFEVADVISISAAESDHLEGLENCIQEHILMMSLTPRTLYHCARKAIRSLLGVPYSKLLIDSLVIPKTLKEYLRFE